MHTQLITFLGELTRLQLVFPGILTQFCAAFGAGFFMATTVAPFDMVRTRLMNQPPDAKIYNGFVDCVLKVRFVVWVVIISYSTTNA